MPLSPIVHRLVESGYLGQKTGAGVYRYVQGDYRPRENPSATDIIAEVRKESGYAPREMGLEDIAERLVMRMVNEAFFIMQDEVVRSPADIDVATVLGIGFPDFRGGLMRFAHDLGHDQVVARLNRLAGEHGERFAPCPALTQKGE